MKRWILLALVSILMTGVATAGGTPAPECSCELCAMDLDQTCQSSWTGLYHPCFWYYGNYCPAS